MNFPKQFRKEALEGRETRRGYVCLLFAFNVPAPEGPELLKRARGCTRVSGVSCAAGVESAGLQSRLSLTCGLGIFLSLLNEPLVFFGSVMKIDKLQTQKACHKYHTSLI